MIEFPIINAINKTSLAFEILVLGGIIIALYFLFPELNSKLLLIPLVIYILYQVSKNDKTEIIGKIYLTKHQVKVETKAIDFQFELGNLDKFELIYSGYSGQRLRGDIIGPFNSFSGIDNYIKIVKNNTDFKCRFLVENSQTENELIQLIQIWEALGYNVNNIRINK